MSRLLANLIIAGGSMLVKAASQAYQKALVNAQRSGVAQEAAKGTAASVFGKKTMALDEARMILGIDAGATLEEAMARYQKMFEANEKASFYLQSKIHRAKERMETLEPSVAKATMLRQLPNREWERRDTEEPRWR